MTTETEVTIEQSIKKEIAKFDPFEKRIGELREQYAGLTIVDINDKEGYENVRLAIADLRGIRTGTEKDKKVIKKPFLDACTTIEQKSKWIIEEVSKIEDPLQKRKDEIDTEKEKIKQEKKAAQEKVFIQRSMQLSGMGVLFDGTNFVLEDASFEGVLVREADDEVYNDFILPKFKVVFDKHEAIRLEEKRIKDEQLAEEQRQREELSRQQEKLKQQQVLFEKQKQDAEKERQELVRKENERIQKERDEERKIVMQKFNDRINKLTGYSFNGMTVKNELGQTFGTVEYVVGLSDDDFNDVVGINNKIIEDNKRIYDEKRKDELQKAQDEAVKKERERIEQQKKDDEIKRQEELAKASDKVKYADLIEQFNNIEVPDMRSGQYRKKVAIIREKLEEIQNL